MNQPRTDKNRKPERTQNRATNLSLNGLSADEGLKAVLSISKEDAARIIGKKPGKPKPGK
jgi:hypothetical protein